MSNILIDCEVATETAQQEQSAWDSANSTATEESYQGYLNIYPTGRHAAQAHACIAKLKKEAAALAKSLAKSVEWIESQDGVRHETNIESSHCYGRVMQADDLHAVQHIGRKNFIVHAQHFLSVRLAVGDEAEISYCKGYVTVAIKEKTSQKIEP